PRAATGGGYGAEGRGGIQMWPGQPPGRGAGPTCASVTPAAATYSVRSAGTAATAACAGGTFCHADVGRSTIGPSAERPISARTAARSAGGAGGGSASYTPGAGGRTTGTGRLAGTSGIAASGRAGGPRPAGRRSPSRT